MIELGAPHGGPDMIEGGNARSRKPSNIGVSIDNASYRYINRSWHISGDGRSYSLFDDEIENYK
jgi:hypothetical protein